MTPADFVPRPAQGLKYPNVVRMFSARMARTPHACALRFKRDGVWQTLTWTQWWDAGRALAAGLLERVGVEPGDPVGLLLDTSIEWLVADLALAMVGAISVPVHPSHTAEHVRHILADAPCAVAIVPSAASVRRALDGLEAPGLKQLITTDDVGSDHDAWDTVGWKTVREAGANALAEAEGPAARRLDGLVDRLKLDDPMTFVYTSGTTGAPKGVVLTHQNIIYESWAIKNVVPVDETDEHLLVLPLAHIFSRHLVWASVEQGATTAVGEGEAAVAENLVEIAPTFMGAVPRIYEKIYQEIVREVIARNVVTRRVFKAAVDVGRRVSLFRRRGQEVPASAAVRMAVADRMFFARVRGLFGGRLRFIVSGGASLDPEIGEFFHACGVLILEGYGLTETTGATNVNRPDRFRFGTVGPAMPGCEVRLAGDGEVLVRGHNVMAGYHNLPRETAAAFDDHGWFRTGDIGELRDGFLRVTDRKDDLFKTTNGKYVAPSAIEERLRVRNGISFGVVAGDGHAFPVALLSLDVEPLMVISNREGLGCSSYGDLAAHPRIFQLCQAHVDAVNANLARHEQIRRFAIVPEPFSEQNGQLTPTRRVRRREVLRHYKATVDELYRDERWADPVGGLPTAQRPTDA